MKKILFVCTGNTCRSPMCAALFNYLYSEKLSSIAFSAGLMADSSPISKNAVSALSEFGVAAESAGNFIDHISHTVTKEDMESADLVFGVTEAHAARLTEMFREYEDEIHALPISIADPYGMDIAAYKRCLGSIDCALGLIFGDTDHVGVTAADDDMLDEIMRIENEAFTCPWSRRSFVEALNSRNITVYAVRDDDGILAGFSCLLVIGSEAELLNIAVSSSHRRMGFADRLMSRMMSDCTKRGVESVYLEVRQSNTPAQILYEKFGFVRLGIRKKYYTDPVEDAVLMRKIISQE